MNYMPQNDGPISVSRLFTRMVKLSRDNQARKMRPEKTKAQKCPYCKGKGIPYAKKNHPSRKDCAGTGIATDWR